MTEPTQIHMATSDLTDIDIVLINIMLTQAKHDAKAVKRAAKFVLERLSEDEQ